MAKLALYWPICSDGYRLVWRGGENTVAAKTLANSGRYQSIVRSSDRLSAVADVMQIPALYERLAACPLTPEGALAFVSKYGFLGKTTREEPVGGICHQMQVVQALLALKRLGNQNALDEWIIQNGKAIRLNAAFKTGQSPRLFFEPVSLIDAIYLQFFQDLESGSNVRLCVRPGCGEWFYYGPGTNPPRRNTAMYCSPACQKGHAYAKRKGMRDDNPQHQRQHHPPRQGLLARQVRNRARSGY